MYFEAASLNMQNGGSFLLVILLLFIGGSQGLRKPNFGENQVCTVGGRSLLQVEDCPPQSVERLRGEVLAHTQFYFKASRAYLSIYRYLSIIINFYQYIDIFED